MLSIFLGSIDKLWVIMAISPSRKQNQHGYLYFTIDGKNLGSLCWAPHHIRNCFIKKEWLQVWLHTCSALSHDPICQSQHTAHTQKCRLAWTDVHVQTHIQSSNCLLSHSVTSISPVSQTSHCNNLYTQMPCFSAPTLLHTNACTPLLCWHTHYSVSALISKAICKTDQEEHSLLFWLPPPATDPLVWGGPVVLHWLSRINGDNGSHMLAVGLRQTNMKHL